MVEQEEEIVRRPKSRTTLVEDEEMVHDFPVKASKRGLKRAQPEPDAQKSPNPSS